MKFLYNFQLCRPWVYPLCNLLISILVRGKTCAKIINISLSTVLSYSRLSNRQKIQSCKIPRLSKFGLFKFFSLSLSITISLNVYQISVPWLRPSIFRRINTMGNESLIFCLSLWTSCFFPEIRYSTKKRKTKKNGSNNGHSSATE